MADDFPAACALRCLQSGEGQWARVVDPLAAGLDRAGKAEDPARIGDAGELVLPIAPQAPAPVDALELAAADHRDQRLVERRDQRRLALANVDHVVAMTDGRPDHA